MPAERHPIRTHTPLPRRAPVLLALALTLGCGGSEQAEGGGAGDAGREPPAPAAGVAATDTTLAVDPGSAMDTTPAGTPAPPDTSR